MWTRMKKVKMTILNVLSREFPENNLKNFLQKMSKFFSIFHKFGNLKSKLIFVKKKLENSEVERNVKKQLKFNL